jgi:hypothetical protein
MAVDSAYIYIAGYDGILGSTNSQWRIEKRVNSDFYYSSGTFTSGIIDVGAPTANWSTLSWTHTGGQTITMKARSCSASDCSGATDWGSCSNITNGNALSTGGCVTDGHQYIQYQAALSTADTSETPSLDDVTIAYSAYPLSQTLTSPNTTRETLTLNWPNLNGMKPLNPAPE